eukprot:741536-Pelagomonas_calceolata.AAC.1
MMHMARDESDLSSQTAIAWHNTPRKWASRKGKGRACRIDKITQGDIQPDCLADQPVAGPCQLTANPKAPT